MKKKKRDFIFKILAIFVEFFSKNFLLCDTDAFLVVFYFEHCSDLLWEKIVQAIEIFFWNLRLMAKNLSKRSLEQFILTGNSQNSFFETEYFGPIMIQIGKTNWDIETYSTN